LVIRGELLPADLPRAVVAGRAALELQPPGDVVNHHRVLVAVVFGVREDEGEQLLEDELLDGPVERVDTRGARRDIGPCVRVAFPWRRVDRDRIERGGGETEVRVALD